MILKDLPIGTIFNIEKTPTYPKMKLKVSYVDMRDQILGNPKITDNKSVDIMTVVDLSWQFGITKEKAQAWIDEIKGKYLASHKQEE